MESEKTERIVTLNKAAGRAMAAADYVTAQEILKRALAVKADPAIWLNYAACARALGDIGGALVAIDEALKLQPRSFFALLTKGNLLEQGGDAHRAAACYRPALQLAPDEQSLEPAARSALARARQFCARYESECLEFLSSTVDELGADTIETRRVRQLIDISLGRKRHYPQEPSEYAYPGLPPIEFWEREEFPWLADLEAQTEQIRAEFEVAMVQASADFRPYVNYPETVPLDQWRELNRSDRWSAMHLYLYGKRVEANCALCPKTLETLERLPMPRVSARSPAAMFSVLKPATRIPAHTGVSNTRLVVHLPLIVPPGCGFRVGNETRIWRSGEAWVFDDTIEHEAWNEGTEPRVVLIFDIWNPRIGSVERDMLTRVISAMDQFTGRGRSFEL